MNVHMLSQLRTTLLASFSVAPLLSGCASGGGCARDAPTQVPIAERSGGFPPVAASSIEYQTASTHVLPAHDIAWLEPAEPALRESSFDLAASPSIGGAPLRVEFDTHVAPPSRGIQYVWEFGDGHEANGPTPMQHTYRQPGTFWAVVTATRGAESTSAAVEIVVEAEAFEVEMDAEPDFGPVPLTVQFEVEVLGIVDGPFRYEWDFGDGRRSHTRAPQHVYRAVGDYVATVTVWNGDGQLGRDAFEINVEPRRRR